MLRADGSPGSLAGHRKRIVRSPFAWIVNVGRALYYCSFAPGYPAFIIVAYVRDSMSWRLFRKGRLRALDSAIQRKKIDTPLINLLGKVGKSEKLAPLSSCAGRTYLAKKSVGNPVPRRYYRIWHTANREEVELALSRYASRQLLWFIVEPFSLHIAAKDISSAFAFVEKMEKHDVSCSLRKRKDHIEITAKGPFGMNFPVNPFEGEWNAVVDIAHRIMDANLALIKKLERKRW
jgi:hypothetical protein